MSKCSCKCIYYRVIKKQGKNKGFCDWYGKFFEEMSKDEIKERTENCAFYKEFEKMRKLGYNYGDY